MKNTNRVRQLIGLWLVLAMFTFQAVSLNPSLRPPAHLVQALEMNPISWPELAVVNLLESGDSRAVNAGPQNSESQASQGAIEEYSKLPMRFEPNLGQVDSQVKFLSRGPGYSLYLTHSEAVLSLANMQRRVNEPDGLILAWRGIKSDIAGLAVLRMRMVGANPKAAMEGENRQPGKSNYLIGNDPEKWRTNVAQYASIRHRQVYPGVDLVYYGNQGQLEYDFIVEPGTNPDRIKLDFEGAQEIRLDAEGNLILSTPTGEIRQHKPFIYQEVDGIRNEVAGGFKLRQDCEVGFEVEKYDTSKPLVIDPVLSYSSYLGGSLGDSGTFNIDGAGNILVRGTTNSLDFPTMGNTLQKNVGGGEDLFITKLDPSGVPVFSTYLGGSQNEVLNSFVSDPSRNIFVIGTTNSPDFPTTANAFQKNVGGGEDLFITKLDPSGVPVFSTYLGGSQNEAGNFTVDDGNIFVRGDTDSPDFPTTANAFQKSFGGERDLFITKLNPSGAAVFSTYLGGSKEESLGVFPLDNSGNVYAIGRTKSSDFPTTANAFQKRFGGKYDLFITKFGLSGAAIFSTYLGGSQKEVGSVSFDQNNIIVRGDTNSSDFPTTANAFQRSFRGGQDLFITKLDPSGAPIFSTFLGGSEKETIDSFSLDQRNIILRGDTNSPDFPTTANAFQRRFGGGRDLFITKLDGSGVPIFSTYLGGSEDEALDTITLDQRNIIVIGDTNSPDFPTTANAFQKSFGGDRDLFITKLDDSGDPIFSTYLGGRGSEPLGSNTSGSFTLDQSSIIVRGTTSSDNFPTTANAFQKSFGGGEDLFITKLDPSGAAVFSTYIGGSEEENLNFFALQARNIFFSGTTFSNDYPTHLPLQPAIRSEVFQDAFITVLDPTGDPIYSTYFGGNGRELLRLFRVNQGGRVLLLGSTGSTDIEVTSDAFQKKNAGRTDFFVAEIERNRDPDILTITNATIIRGDLYVVGAKFSEEGATILLNGTEIETKSDNQDPTVLISRRAGRLIERGQTVRLQVRNADGRLSAVFSFTPPI